MTGKYSKKKPNRERERKRGPGGNPSVAGEAAARVPVPILGLILPGQVEEKTIEDDQPIERLPLVSSISRARYPFGLRELSEKLFYLER